ncbi:MAG: hypothetical protein V1743_06650 [Nanoarchaeota archaeon]
MTMKELDACNLCGRCNSTCPVFRAVKKETGSNRNKAFLLKKGTLTLRLFSFTLDGSVTQACPAGIDADTALLTLREKANIKGIQTASNKEIIGNLRRWGNPYGNPAVIKKRGEIKPYYG